MISRFNVSVLYKNSAQPKIQQYVREGLREYGFNNNQTMVYFQEKLESDDDTKMKEAVFWIPVADILDMKVEIVRTFETKREKLEFYKGIKQ